jgi:hypothetical protein
MDIIQVWIDVSDPRTGVTRTFRGDTSMPLLNTMPELQSQPDPHFKVEIPAVDGAVTVHYAETIELLKEALADEYVVPSAPYDVQAGVKIKVREWAPSIPVAGPVIRVGYTLRDTVIDAFYGRARLAVKDWDDSGVVSATLSDFVTARDPWKRSDFDRVFEMPRHRASLLLRLHGYERSADEAGNELWKRGDELEPSRDR